MFKSTIVEIIKSYNHNRPPFTEYLRGRGCKQYLLLSEYLFVGNMTMTSFPGSTFSWQSNIYTYAFIYYNLHPVPKGGGGLGSSVPVPCCPCLVSHIVPRRSYHHPPASSWQLSTSSHPSSSTFHLPTATESRPIIKKYYPCATFFHVTRITD